MYGFWGEGHTNELPKPFRRDLPAEKSCVRMTQLQLMTRRTPLIMNAEPGISSVGNCQVQDLAARASCWPRSEDSLIIEE
jgi:hypothetical protein